MPTRLRPRRRREHLVEVVLVVGQAGEDGRDQDAGADAGLREPSEDLEALPPGRCAGLDDAAHVLVERADAHRDGERRDVVQPLEDVEVACDQRRLRQDRERVAEVRERLDDPPGQPVARLALLVRVGRGPHRDGLALPARRGELAAEHLGDVRLMTIFEEKSSPMSMSRYVWNARAKQ